MLSANDATVTNVPRSRRSAEGHCVGWVRALALRNLHILDSTCQELNCSPELPQCPQSTLRFLLQRGARPAERTESAGNQALRGMQPTGRAGWPGLPSVPHCCSLHAKGRLCQGHARRPLASQGSVTHAPEGGITFVSHASVTWCQTLASPTHRLHVTAWRHLC